MPGTLVRGSVRPDYNCFKILDFDGSTHATQHVNPTNGSKAVTVEATTMYPSGNIQGDSIKYHSPPGRGSTCTNG